MNLPIIILHDIKAGHVCQMLCLHRSSGHSGLRTTLVLPFRPFLLLLLRGWDESFVSLAATLPTENCFNCGTSWTNRTVLLMFIAAGGEGEGEGLPMNVTISGYMFLGLNKPCQGVATPLARDSTANTSAPPFRSRDLSVVCNTVCLLLYTKWLRSWGAEYA